MGLGFNFKRNEHRCFKGVTDNLPLVMELLGAGSLVKEAVSNRELDTAEMARFREHLLSRDVLFQARNRGVGAFDVKEFYQNLDKYLESIEEILAWENFYSRPLKEKKREVSLEEMRNHWKQKRDSFLAAKVDYSSCL